MREFVWAVFMTAIFAGPRATRIGLLVAITWAALLAASAMRGPLVAHLGESFVRGARSARSEWRASRAECLPRLLRRSPLQSRGSFKFRRDPFLKD